jgi:hypothetical protein
LDRIEQRAHIEGFYRIQPETKLILGYQFTDLDFTSDEVISGSVFALPGAPVNDSNTLDPLHSDYRNSRRHTVYVGAEHKFLPELTGSLRVGGSYTDYYNSSEDASYTPYVLANLKYSYAPESYVEAGFSYDRSATDVVGGAFGTTTLDSEAAVVFADVTHRITPFLFGSLMAQFQNSDYNGGVYNGESEQYYLLGLDLEYRFTRYFSAHAGYNYDRLESDLGRQYDRNRVYVGVTATY